MISKLNKKHEYLVADIFTLPPKVDTSVIQSAGEFIILAHLNRPLVRLNALAKIEGDLADQWSVEDEFKKFVFTISSTAYWSDGTKITSNDVVQTLLRQIKLQTANHFNFNEIKSVVADGDSRVIITLKNKNVSFIRHATYPEFGVLHKTQLSKSVGNLDYKITSGPYFLENKEEGKYYLAKNQYYNNFAPTPPEKILFQSTEISNQINGLLRKDIHFAIPQDELTRNQHEKIINNQNLSVTYPHFGYSVWITINPKSQVFIDLKTRHWIQSVLDMKKVSLQQEAPFWEVARQLYLPDGLGRPSENEIQKIWSEIRKKSTKPKEAIKLRLLIRSNFPFKRQVVEILRSQNIDVIVTECVSVTDLKNKIKTGEYDLLQRGNDFSSEDLHENLQTTFNPVSPLIYTDGEDDQFQPDLKIALQSSSDEERHYVYSQIGKKILLKGYIAPLFYQKVIYYYQQEIDISRLSTLFPEVAMWKISVKK